MDITVKLLVSGNTRTGIPYIKGTPFKKAYSLPDQKTVPPNKADRKFG
ncbi:hypothetical protein [Ruminococcus albus]|nr:hypothetical protein [Ruminococcus albus]